MTGWAQTFTWMAYSTAIGAFTLALAALALKVVARRRRAAAIQRRAIDSARNLNVGDRFKAARKQAHDAGLPWLEADGSVSWPDRDAGRAL